jgi:hydroxylamine reductase (hybrid-cluster protein)
MPRRPKNLTGKAKGRIQDLMIHFQMPNEQKRSLKKFREKSEFMGNWGNAWANTSYY